MQSSLSSNVSKTFNTITIVLGTSFSLRQLVRYVESWRQKILHIEPDVMPPGMTGYCVALLDLDLICVRSDLDAVLERISILHELAHFLLGHIEQFSKGEKTPSYRSFIQRRDQETLIYRKRFFDALHYVDREQDAEALATLLFECIQRYENDLPDIIKNLHG